MGPTGQAGPIFYAFLGTLNYFFIKNSWQVGLGPSRCVLGQAGPEKCVAHKKYEFTQASPTLQFDLMDWDEQPDLIPLVICRRTCWFPWLLFYICDVFTTQLLLLLVIWHLQSHGLAGRVGFYTWYEITYSYSNNLKYDIL